MPSSDTISGFTSFTANTTIYSSQVNANFAIWRGHILPMSTSSVAGASNTYDLGSTTYKWRTLYIDTSINNSGNSAASTPAGFYSGTWFTGGTSTTTKPHFLIETAGATSNAWSTSGTGLGVNAASGFVGRLFDCQVNGTSIIRCTATGSFSVTGSGSDKGVITVTHSDNVPTQSNLFAFNGSSTSVFINGDLSGGITSGSSGTATGARLEKSTSTGRSLNAAGTVNASGADYAEYLDKQNPNDIFQKGDICGINSDGKLVKRFNEAIHFMVKSTDPSYVGNDRWFNRDKHPGESDKDYRDAEGVARQVVDRIAFCGQTPCNVQGNPGQWIVPIALPSGFIGYQAIDEDLLTLSQYKKAIGKIFKVLSPTQCLIAVGVK